MSTLTFEKSPRPSTTPSYFNVTSAASAEETINAANAGWKRTMMMQYYLDVDDIWPKKNYERQKEAMIHYLCAVDGTGRSTIISIFRFHIFEVKIPQ